MIYTSLEKMLSYGSYLHATPEFNKLMDFCGKDYLTLDYSGTNETNLSFKQIADLTDLEYALQCVSTRLDLHKLWRSYAIWCASLLKDHVTLDECKVALAAAEEFQQDIISEAQLAEIHNIAWSANVHSNISCLSVEGSANYACVNASMPNVDGCIISAYQSCRIGLDGLKVNSSEIDRMLLDKFTELVVNN
jgi:hypothetical protein